MNSPIECEMANEVAGAPPPAILEFEALSKSFFGIPVLREITLALPRGRTLGLVGENGAGKSTLMNLLGGNLSPDSGRMRFAGAEYLPKNARDAHSAGIAFIHQELNLFPNLSIQENIFITSFPKVSHWLPFIERKRLRALAKELLARVGLNVPPETLVERLSAGEQQLVEIARALSLDAKLMIFDEPTTSLTAPETAHLFALIERLRGQGVTLIYISHVLNDVLRLCDDIIVLRDGAIVSHGPKQSYTIDRMISEMVGRSITQFYPVREKAASSEPVLEVADLSRAGTVENISFILRRGEVLGLSGLMGSGRSELARVLFGMDSMTSGTVRLCGKALVRATPRECIRRGFAFLTEDRRVEGLFLDDSIGNNITLASLRAHARGPFGILNGKSLKAAISAIRKAVGLTSPAPDGQAVKTLSGGNQQKVVLAKWLLLNPAVLILDEPTRGIDVGAKSEIYGLINELAAGGAGILLISSELEELAGMCDRILVMRRGRISDEMTVFDRERLLRSALQEGRP